MSIRFKIAKVTDRYEIFAPMPWKDALPPGSNLENLMEKGVPSTSGILSFHLRRALLTACHNAVGRWSSSPPSLAHRIVSRSFRAVSSSEVPVDHYMSEVGKIEQLLNMDTTNGPKHVATSFRLKRGSPEDPEDPAASEMEVENLISKAADVVTWVVLSKSVQRLTIFEKSEALRFVDRDHLINAINAKVKAINVPTRPIDITFAGERHIVPEGTLAVVFASDRLGGVPCQQKFGFLPPNEAAIKLIDSDTPPDLFIAFDSRSNGFPLAALTEALVFTPQRGEALASARPLLCDYIRAFKTCKAQNQE